MEYKWALMNAEEYGFREAREYLYKMMESEVSRTKTIYTILIAL